MSRVLTACVAWGKAVAETSPGNWASHRSCGTRAFLVSGSYPTFYDEWSGIKLGLVASIQDLCMKTQLLQSNSSVAAPRYPTNIRFCSRLQLESISSTSIVADVGEGAVHKATRTTCYSLYISNIVPPLPPLRVFVCPEPLRLSLTVRSDKGNTEHDDTEAVIGLAVHLLVHHTTPCRK